MNENCLESIPYASIIGFILMIFGCGVFSGTVWEGSERIDKLFRERFYPFTEVEYIKSAGVTYAVITLLIGFVILIFGSIVSGNNRIKNLQSSDCQKFGKLSAGLLLTCCYVLLIGWLIVICAGMVSVTVWMMVSTICQNEMAYWNSITTNKDEAPFTYSFNLSNYGIYKTDPKTVTKIDTVQGFQQFCSEISTIGPLFSVGFVCSIVVVLSLLTLISALASNIVRIKYHPELSRFHQAAYSSIADFSDPQRATNSMATHSSYPDPQSPHYVSQPLEMQPLTSNNFSSTYSTNDANNRSSQFIQYSQYNRQPNTSLV